MIEVAILSTPLAISAMLGAALFAIWRRRRQAAHAVSWSAAFIMIATGWAAVIGATGVLQRPPLPGAAPSLCWLAAALLLVQGLRHRAERPNRAAQLAAIWTTIALATSLLLDLSPKMGAAGPPTLALLTGLGLLLAAVAVGPRSLSGGHFVDWCAAALIAAFGLANLLLVAGLFVIGPETTQAVALIALGGSVVYVALGLATVLLLNQDFGIALEKLARTDPLTGVWNRRGFDEMAPKVIGRLREARRDRAAVAIADIDSFKGINDSHGHTTGDAVLVRFAELLGTAVRPGDLLARLGGEEFVLLAIGVDSVELFQRVEHLRCLVALPSDDDVTLPSITASFGVAQVNPESLALRDAMERADHALYQAKREGRNRTVIDNWPHPLVPEVATSVTTGKAAR